MRMPVGEDEPARVMIAGKTLRGRARSRRDDPKEARGAGRGMTFGASATKERVS
jgi:hypothetical protein